MSITCERCDGKGPLTTSGPFAGSCQDVFYCTHCSKNLCDPCLESGSCSDSPDGKHKPDWCDKCDAFLDECECVAEVPA